MVNQQKQVQQETAYSAVVVNDIPVSPTCFYERQKPYRDREQ